MKCPIEITKSAARFICDILTCPENKNIKLEMVEGGSQGHEYKWTATSETTGDIAIRLNKENVLYLDRTTAEKMYASAIILEQQGDKRCLTIVNPNLKGSCNLSVAT
jgi:Fe-S cluster assembly iron-binding protein IscA